MGEQLARVLRGRKSDLVTTVEVDGQPSNAIRQTGGAYLDGRFKLPPIDWELPGSEPLIETFVVEPDGTCSGTGGDQRLIDAWLPSVEQLSRRVFEAMAEADVRLESPAYLTASLTSPDQVTNTPHFDDDQYGADDGVGFVAIAGSGRGPRMAIDPVRCEPVRTGLPLAVDSAVFDGFADGRSAAQQAEPDRIVVFPQFGQLHSGPSMTGYQPETDEPETQEPETGEIGSLRRLLVFRAQTVPTTAESGSGPT